MTPPPGRPDAGPGTDGHAPTSPETSPDSKPAEDAPPTEPSPDASEVDRDDVDDEGGEGQTDEDELLVAGPEDEPPD